MGYHRHACKRGHQHGEVSCAKGPSHYRHRQRRARKLRRERELRDAWVTELYGQRGHGACGRKLRFRSRPECSEYIDAHRIARQMWAYRCRYCNGWHLTSHPEDGCVRLDRGRSSVDPSEWV